MIFYKIKEIVISATNPITFINLEMISIISSWTISHFPKEINISGRKKIVINIIVNSSFDMHDKISVYRTDMM